MITFTTRKKVLLATTLAVIIAGALLYVVYQGILLYVVHRLRNVGVIKAIGVNFYWDNACTQSCAEIDWGSCHPGNTYGITVFCKNVENTAVVMNLTTENWNPATAAIYLTGSWNYTGATIQPGQVFPIQFILKIAANVTGVTNFSFEFVVDVKEVVT